MRDCAFGDFSAARDDHPVGGADQSLCTVGSRAGDCGFDTRGIGLHDGELDPERTRIRLDLMCPLRAARVAAISAAEQQRGFRQFRYHLLEYLDALAIDAPVHRGETGDVAAGPRRCQRTRVSGRMIVRTFRIDGNQRYSWTRNQRSLFASCHATCAAKQSTDVGAPHSQLQAGSST